jgi:pimeloyl-ACP methyl ester carboxylesterase
VLTTSIDRTKYVVDFFSHKQDTFRQRYFVFDKHRSNSTGNDVALLYICGEAMCSGTPQNYAIDYARELGASLLTLEHRYYGKSVPVPTLSTQNLRHLTTQQALADLAYFIQFYGKHAKLHKPKWIIIGCSYAGALSAWFRLKYPHLVVGALSSSGVVNAILNFWEFDDQIRISTGPKCSAQLRRVTNIMERQFEKGNKQLVKQLFNAQDLEDDDFWFLVADAAAESIQYGFHDEVCDPMLQHEHSDDEVLLNIFAQFVREFFYKQFDTVRSF